MISGTLVRDLSNGGRFVVANARVEDGAFVGDATIYDSLGKPRFDNLVTIDQCGALAFIESIPTDVKVTDSGQALTGELLEPLLELALDSAAALNTSSPPLRREYPRAGGGTLVATNAHLDAEGHLRAVLTKRDAAGNLDGPPHNALFDGSAAAYHACQFLNLGPSLLADIERDLRELIAPPIPHRQQRIVLAGDIPLTPPDYLIDGVLTKNSLAALVAKEASYKTFVAIDMAASIFTGQRWDGRDVERGAVLYLSAEGQAGLRRRLRAWEIVHHADLSRLACLPTSVDFLEQGDFGNMEAEIKALDPAPTLIVVDTLARNFGGDENSTQDMNGFIAACDRLRMLTGACVLIVHHENKTGGYRGSSAFAGAMDTMIEAKRDDSTVVLTCKKQKDDGEFAPIRLAARVVDLGIADRHNKPLTSIVLEAAQKAAPRLASAPNRSAKACKAYESLIHLGGPSHSPIGSGPAQWPSRRSALRFKNWSSAVMS